MKLTACSGVAARRSQTTPSAMVRLERWDGCTTDTRFAYSDGCQASDGFLWPLGARPLTGAGRGGSLPRGSNSSSIETSSSCANEYRVATEGCDLPFSICDTNDGDTLAL